MVIRAFLEGRSITTRPTEAFFNLFFRYSRTRISSISMVLYSLWSAYQRELQLRFTARRNPIGLTFCPIVTPLCAYLDHNVAGLLFNSGTAAFGACGETFQRSGFVNVNFLDAQLVDIGTIVMLGISNSRLKYFLDNASGFFWRERKNIQCLLYRLSANLVGDQAGFLSRDTYSTNFCCGFRSEEHTSEL